MVVLSASVCTRQGKALVSRQFVEMNRLRVEGLLAAFPKLVEHGQQHTYIETDSVRYVYQPLENAMYLLLITTKTSNIVEDLSTLRLLAKVVPDVAGGLQEHAVSDKAFDLIFAFDEVITAGGYKEEATLSSIRTNLLMESHEEKIHMALKQAKEDEAKKKADDVAKALRKQQMENLRQNLVSGGNAPVAGKLSGMEGFGGGGPSAGGFDPFQENPQQQAAPNMNDPYAHLAPQDTPAEAPKVFAKSGMKLGGAGPAKGGLGLGGAAGGQKDIFASLAKEDNLSMGGGGGGVASAFDLSAPSKAPAATPSTPLSLALEEKITVQMSREGDVQSCEVKGTLTLTANTDAGTMALVSVDKSALPANFSYATHPKVDKKTYESKGVLSLKGGKGFPMQRGVGILRWTYSGEDAAPLTINCWPEDEGSGTINVNIEMEMTRTDLVLQDVNILLPLGTTDPPAIENIDGIYKHDPASGMLCWHFDQLDANTQSGSLEFTVAGSNTDVFFPVQVGFRAETLLCPVTVTGVTHSQHGTAIPNQMMKSFTPDSYLCA
mmetsp:Transcript_22290/g.61923  ORF Transcript_22290/g.61923 Transcript_22290/m.61923 type:complete len:549 (-) Transcript_22290:189-1835(-)